MGLKLAPDFHRVLKSTIMKKPYNLLGFLCQVSYLALFRVCMVIPSFSKLVILILSTFIFNRTKFLEPSELITRTMSTKNNEHVNLIFIVSVMTTLNILCWIEKAPWLFIWFLFSTFYNFLSVGCIDKKFFI